MPILVQMRLHIRRTGVQSRRKSDKTHDILPRENITIDPNTACKPYAMESKDRKPPIKLFHLW